jgi:ATP-binding cassette, subfamily B, bacterial PglK
VIRLVRDLYIVVRPSGLRRLALVMSLVVLQGITQTIGVFSILPFLSAASDTAGFRNSRIGSAFVDAIGGGSDERVLLWAGSVSIAILVLGNAIALIAEYQRSRYAHGIEQLLRTSLLAGLLNRPYEYFTKANSGFLLKVLLQDTSAVAGRMILPAIDIVSRSLLVLFLVTGLFAFDPGLVLSGAAVLALYFAIVMVPVQRSAQATSEKVKRDVPLLYREILQILNGHKPIIATGSRTYFVGRAQRASQAVLEEIPRVQMYSSLPRCGLEILLSGGITVWILVALAGAGSLIELMPRLALVAVVAYRLMPSIQLIFGQIGAMHSSRHSLDEVLCLISEQVASPPAVSCDGGSVRPLQWSSEIRFENVSFSYAGSEKPAVRDVSFTIRKGERVAFVGPTGAGKSTLIDLLLGLLEPTAGRILVDGKPLATEMMTSWQLAVGYAPQELYLVDGTITENIAFGADPAWVDDRRLGEVIEIAQGHDFVTRIGSDAIDAVGERGVKLSGGERQRVGIARALYGNPSILVLDEATSGLDTQTERKIMEILSRDPLLTVVTVTHRIGSLTDYDCLHHVANGRIARSERLATPIAATRLAG